jgi:hypothetical protein
MPELSLFDSTRQGAEIFRTLGGVLGQMRDSDGRPKGRVRVIALLAAIGLIAMSAPAVVPLVRWIADLVW